MTKSLTIIRINIMLNVIIVNIKDLKENFLLNKTIAFAHTKITVTFTKQVMINKVFSNEILYVYLINKYTIYKVSRSNSFCTRAALYHSISRFGMPIENLKT